VARAAAQRRADLLAAQRERQLRELNDQLEERVRAWVFVDRDGARAEAERLAAEAEAGSIEAFAERWMGQPLFAGTPPRAARHWRADLLRNDPAALAAVLRGVGAGAMAPLWDRLPELQTPVTLVVGERDEKFRAIAERMRERLPHAELVIVPGAGHAAQLESPERVAQAISYQSGSPSSSASA
jgi:pimeloyl-ACP methyl ester carboxylesterase